MANSNFRERYDKLKFVSTFALKTSEQYTHYRGVHGDTYDVELHTRFVIAIRNKWFELRKDMISKHGTQSLEITPVSEPEVPNDEVIDVMWQHWRITKSCIEAVKSGLRKHKLL